MLKNPHFYHQITRKSVILFGRLFDDILLVNKDANGKEYKRILVPIIYSPKEKMVTRLFSDPDLYKQVQVVLPRMGFEITSVTYDAQRKQNSLLKVVKSVASSDIPSTYMAVPYDIKFRLNIYTRNIDDGTQIVEQILPFFNPDYTVTANMVPDLGVLKDIAVILNSVDNNIEYEGNFDSVRYVNWTLDFTMKTWYYGPVSTSKIIRDIRVNMIDDDELAPGAYIIINTRNPEGKFKNDDIAFQGKSLNTATAKGIIVKYNQQYNQNVANTLVLVGVEGKFRQNVQIHCVSTNGTCNVSSFKFQKEELAKIRIRPNPLDAEPGDDYGYNVQIVEGTWNDFPPDHVNPWANTYLTDNTSITTDTTILTTDDDL